MIRRVRAAAHKTYWFSYYHVGAWMEINGYQRWQVFFYAYSWVALVFVVIYRLY